MTAPAKRVAKRELPREFLSPFSRTRDHGMQRGPNSKCKQQLSLTLNSAQKNEFIKNASIDAHHSPVMALSIRKTFHSKSLAHSPVM